MIWYILDCIREEFIIFNKKTVYVKLFSSSYVTKLPIKTWNMKKIKFLVTALTVFIFLITAVGSGDDKSSSSSSSTKVESNECYICDGIGKVYPETPPGFVSKWRKCTSCNGTGKK